ncbi:MAG: hypothetical protein QXY19_02910 [Archaeoglobaceae archaeon]
MSLESRLGILFLILSILIQLITLPTSPSSFYGPSHYYNLYLPNFGLSYEISILPHAAKTVLGMYGLHKVILTILNENVLLLHSAIHLLSPIFVFLSFYLFFTAINFKRKRTLMSGIFSIIFSWAPIALLLGMMCIFTVMNKGTKYTLILLPSFLTLSLYWHSAHMLFFISMVFLLIYLIIVKVPAKDNFSEEMRKMIFLLVISTFVWIWIRELYGAKNWKDLWLYFELEKIFRGLFLKGSFVPVEYQYADPITELSFFIDYFRYIVYVVVIMSILFYSLSSLWGKKLEQYGLGLPLLCGAATFILLYYISTEIFGPAPIMVFLIPYFLAMTLNKIELGLNTKKYRLLLALFLTMICFLAISCFYYKYVDLKTASEFNQNFEVFKPPIHWLSEHKDECYLLSDADTMGYMAIWYGKDTLYNRSKIYYSSIGNYQYDRLFKGLYDDNYVVIYNYELYIKNLVFRSLQSWNKYKPLNSSIALKNDLGIIYNSNKIWILEKV